MGIMSTLCGELEKEYYGDFGAHSPRPSVNVNDVDVTNTIQSDHNVQVEDS